MGQPIKSNEIIEQNALVDFIAKGEIALDIMQKMREEFKEVAKASKKVVSGGGALKKAKDIEKFREAIDKTNAAFRETQRLEKEEVKLQAKLDASYSKTATDVAKLKLEVNRRNKQLKEEAILSSKTTGNYEKASLTLRRLKRQYQNLAVAQGTNSKAAKKLAKEIQLEDARLKKIDKTIGDSFRNVGNYSSAIGGLSQKFKRLAGALGITGGIIAFSRAIRGAFRTMVDFQKSSAELASVLGKSRSEIKQLTVDAKRLGAATKFTASEVVGLQKEFAKLGFSQQEILNVTEATLELAVATTTELPRAAEVVGNTLRAFQLDSSETQRVVDVMTKSFNSSALDMEKFATAMGSVAPVAANANVTLEDTTALLGTIVNNGVDASTAGTALRNVFLELAKNGLTFDEAMAKINSSTNRNATALDLFGKRGAAVASIIANNTEKTKELGDALRDSLGTAADAANEQMDTMSGKMAEAGSAWEGFILALESGDGIIARVIGGAIELVTTLLQDLAELTKSSEQKFLEARTSSQSSAQGVADTRLKNITKVVGRGIDELQAKLDDFNSGAAKDVDLVTAQLIKRVINARKEGLSSTQILINEQNKQLIEQGGEAENLTKRLDGIISQAKERGTDLENVRKSVRVKNLIEEADLANAFQTKASAELTSTIKSASEEELNASLLTAQGKLKTKIEFELAARQLDEETASASVSSTSKAATERKKILDKEAREAEKRRQDEIKAEKLRVKTLNAIRNASDKGRILDAKEATDEAIKEQKRLGLEGKDIDTEAFIDELDFEFELRKAKELDEREFLLNQTGITEEQKRLIIIQSDARLLAIDKEKNERIIQGQDEIIEAQIEGFDKVNEVAKASADKRKKEQQELVDGIKLLATETIAFLDRISDKQLAIIDKQATKQQKRIDNLQAKAVEGRLDLTDSVAEEEKRLEELEARRAKIEKQKQRRQAFITGLGILESKIKNNETGALSKTFSDLIKLSSFVTSLPTFFEGTENVSGTDASMKLNTPIDPFVVRVHPGERIMSASDNAKIGKMSNSELVEVASMYKTGFVDQPVYQQSGTDSMAIYRMTKAITEGNKKLLDKPTYLGGDFDDAREAWVLSIQKGATLEKRALKINRGY